jgi:hypothetical protein
MQVLIAAAKNASTQGKRKDRPVDLGGIIKSARNIFLYYSIEAMKVFRIGVSSGHTSGRVQLPRIIFKH